jgi:hypothetical protein
VGPAQQSNIGQSFFLSTTRRWLPVLASVSIPYEVLCESAKNNCTKKIMREISNTWASSKKHARETTRQKQKTKRNTTKTNRRHESKRCKLALSLAKFQGDQKHAKGAVGQVQRRQLISKNGETKNGPKGDNDGSNVYAQILSKGQSTVET